MKQVTHSLYGTGSVIETKKLSKGGQMLYVKFASITMWVDPTSDWIS